MSQKYVALHIGEKDLSKQTKNS